jgi:hypothetical protein
MIIIVFGTINGPGVIELYQKSVKFVKFSKVNDALGSKKQCHRRTQS